MWWLRPLSMLISWRNMHVLRMERKKDAGGFKEDFGQKVLSWVEEWKRGKEPGVYWILTFAIRIQTMSWNRFCTSLFYLFEGFYQFLNKLNGTFIKAKEELFSIPQERVGTQNIPRSYGAGSCPFSKFLERTSGAGENTVEQELRISQEAIQCNLIL